MLASASHSVGPKPKPKPPTNQPTNSLTQPAPRTDSSDTGEGSNPTVQCSAVLEQCQHKHKTQPERQPEPKSCASSFLWELVVFLFLRVFRKNKKYKRSAKEKKRHRNKKRRANQKKTKNDAGTSKHIS